MFGLFQADMPIGNRLWLALLAIVVAGSIAATPLAQATNDPISFATNLLLLYGQASFVSAFLVMIPSLPIMLIEFQIKNRADKNRPEFFIETEDYVPLWERISTFLLLIAYLAVVLWIAKGHFSSQLGGLGLALVLLAELLTEWRGVYLIGYEFLELTKRDEPKGITALLISNEQEKRYQLGNAWMHTLAYLGDNNWELLNSAKSFALLRRKYRKSLIPKRWVEAMPNPIQRIIESRPKRGRSKHAA